MGLFSFIREAGEKLFGSGEAKAAHDEAKRDPTPANRTRADKAASGAIVTYIGMLGLKCENLAVGFDGASGKATVAGRAPDQKTKEKILLAAGNVEGVGEVEDRLEVANPEPEARFYTVVAGDTLSGIANRFYGNPNKYPVVFEANKPMLQHPDKIYPGQVLRIPPDA